MKPMPLLLLALLVRTSSAETEPNGSLATANVATSGQNVTGQIASTSDLDCFRYTVASAATVSVMFDSPQNTVGSGFGYHTVQITDGSGNVMASVDTGADTSFQTVVPSGTFYAVVKDGPYSFSSTGQYVLSVTTSAVASSVESETNNAIGTSDTLTLGQKTFGQLQSLTDEDWFAVTVESPGTLTVDFDSPESSSLFGYHTVQIRNASAVVLAATDTGKDTILQTDLPSAGSYFLVVRNGPDAPSFLCSFQYGFTVSKAGRSGGSVLQAEISPAVEVSWMSSAGKSYVVEWSADMTASAWSPVSGSLTGTGNRMNFFDAIRDRPKGFYRVKEN
jgi:hypothetical protein